MNTHDLSRAEVSVRCICMARVAVVNRPSCARSLFAPYLPRSSRRKNLGKVHLSVCICPQAKNYDPDSGLCRKLIFLNLRGTLFGISICSCLRAWLKPLIVHFLSRSSQLQQLPLDLEKT